MYLSKINKPRRISTYLYGINSFVLIVQRESCFPTQQFFGTLVKYNCVVRKFAITFVFFDMILTNKCFHKLVYIIHTPQSAHPNLFVCGFPSCVLVLEWGWYQPCSLSVLDTCQRVILANIVFANWLCVYIINIHTSNICVYETDKPQNTVMGSEVQCSWDGCIRFAGSRKGFGLLCGWVYWTTLPVESESQSVENVCIHSKPNKQTKCPTRKQPCCAPLYNLSSR